MQMQKYENIIIWQKKDSILWKSTQLQNIITRRLLPLWGRTVLLVSVLPDGALGQFPVAGFVGAAAEDEALGFEGLEAALDSGFGDAELLGIAGIGEGAVLLVQKREPGWAPFRYRADSAYFSISARTFLKASMHLSRCSCSWAALICTRIRAWPFGTTG